MTAFAHQAPVPDCWAAELKLGFELRGGRTVLATSQRLGPLTVQRPFYPEGPSCHCYLLHPPGGVVGGDRLDLQIGTGAGAHALVTTPGATKWYRSAGPTATMTQSLSVATGGALEWLPQCNILFPGARCTLETRVEISDGARFIGWEVHTLGRPGIGERFRDGHAQIAFELRRTGRPLLVERLRLDGERDLNGPTGLRGHAVSGALVASPADSEDINAARASLPASPGSMAAITLVDGLLIARCLGQAIEPVMANLTGIWAALRPRLLGHPSCPPRIWAT